MSRTYKDMPFRVQAKHKNALALVRSGEVHAIHRCYEHSSPAWNRWSVGTPVCTIDQNLRRGQARVKVDGVWVLQCFWDVEFRYYCDCEWCSGAPEGRSRARQRTLARRAVKEHRAGGDGSVSDSDTPRKLR